MALTEREYYTWDKQGEFGHIGVRKVTVIEKDGREISKTYHRHVIDPDSDLTNEAPEVQAIAKAAWTPEVVTAYKAMIEV